MSLSSGLCNIRRRDILGCMTLTMIALWSSETWKTTCPTTQWHLPKLLVQPHSNISQYYMSNYIVTSPNTTCLNTQWHLPKPLVQLYSDISQKSCIFSCDNVHSLTLFYFLYELTQHPQMEDAIIATGFVGGSTLIVTSIMRPHVGNNEWISVWRQHHSWSCVRGYGQVILTPRYLKNTDSSEDVEGSSLPHDWRQVRLRVFLPHIILYHADSQVCRCVGTLFVTSSHSAQVNKECTCITETALTVE